MLYYPLGFHFLTNCFFIYRYSLRLETEQFKRSPSDYVFLLFFNWICLVIVGCIANFYVSVYQHEIFYQIWEMYMCKLNFFFKYLMDPMVISVVYVWSQLNTNTTVIFWFGTQFKAMYLPWALLAIHWIVTNTLLEPFMGIVVGHLYFFLKFKYPREMGGASYLETPAFLYVVKRNFIKIYYWYNWSLLFFFSRKRYFPDAVGVIHGFQMLAPQNRRDAPNNRNSNNWGRGQTLGNK